MFTGIIQEIGSIHDVRPIGSGVQLMVRAPEITAELKVGDSISINGVCQTVIQKEMEFFSVTAVEETLRKTTLGNMVRTARVNLELAMRLDDRIGGHLVSGHVDCVGEIQSIEQRGVSWFFQVLIPQQFHRYVIPIGSIALDGVSLTVASVTRGFVGVSLVPHTMENTIFATYKAKSQINIEFDMMGKYVEKLLGTTAIGGDPISNDLNEEVGVRSLKDRLDS